MRPWERVLQRALDLLVSTVLLTAFAPVLVVVAVLVRRWLGRPVFFRQTRPGLGGRPFLLLKFRTMTDARDAEGRLLPDSERLTRLGRWIRKTSLDELPQLLNVLRGDMSLVGPRPLLMQYLDRYSPEQARRHQVKPGITGWAQVNGRNTISWDERFRLDVWYVDHQSLWLNIRILALTVLKVIRSEGVEGRESVTMPEFMGLGGAGAVNGNLQDRKCNVLISSSGRRGALVKIFQRTLRDMQLDGKVLACDASPLASAFQLADERFVVPRCSSSDFVPTLLRECVARNVSLIVPTIDPELVVYAENRERFRTIGTDVLVSAPEVIQIGNDKRKTHSWLVANGFPTVEQVEVAEVLAGRAGLEFPLIVKPVRGSSSIGVSIVRNAEELRAATAQGDFIAQSIARGKEYTTDILIDRNGKCICAVPRMRIETRAGEVSKGMAVRVRPVMELATRIGETLPGAYGVLNVQAIYDEASGEMNVIEINARFGGGYPLSWEAGADYPRWLIEQFLGARLEPRDTWRDRLVMLRFDDAVFVDAESVGL